jgi:hypothetical protein
LFIGAPSVFDPAPEFAVVAAGILISPNDARRGAPSVGGDTTGGEFGNPGHSISHAPDVLDICPLRTLIGVLSDTPDVDVAVAGVVVRSISAANAAAVLCEFPSFAGTGIGEGELLDGIVVIPAACALAAAAAIDDESDGGNDERR